MLELKKDKNGDGQCYPCMGCRSFLTPYVDEDGKPKYYGRFNQGVVTINLVDIALSSDGDFKKFWKICDERLELCHRALHMRHERLAKATSDVAPILWQHGALARLGKGESIHDLLHGGYSTISLGYAGLYECVKYMTGHSHTDNGKGKDFALEVMQALNDACKKWKEEEDIDYSVYGTPIESTTYKFAKCLRDRFGVIKGVTDRNYITNSYHVPVFEEIDAFTKLSLESEFQKLSPGGAISYVETANLTNNLDAVLEVINFIYNNIMYAELNTKSDYCQECGYTGEILIDENLDWYCPQCGNRDHNKLNVARRTCGYIGTNFWNKGRTQEIKERVIHVDNKDA
jgi:ribonucleoside-triphosphate reductase